MKALNKPICSFAELRNSYHITIDKLEKEKASNERNLAETINTLRNKLSNAKNKLLATLDKKPELKDLPIGSGVIADPKQLKLYYKKIDELSRKNTALEAENKSLKDSLDFYRTSSTKLNTNTQEKQRLTDEKNQAIKELEEFKEKFENDTKKLKEEMQNNKLLLVLKGEKDKIEKESQEMNRLYQTILSKNQELHQENEALDKKINECSKTILTLNNEKDKYKSEYMKIAVERKSLIEYLKETKSTYEKEIENLNEKLLLNSKSSSDQNSIKKNVNELSMLIVDYITLKYCNRYSISIFDVLSIIISKQNIFKLFQSKKIEMNHILYTMFTDIVTLLKFNPKSECEDLLNKYNFFKADKSTDIDDILEKISKIEDFDLESIKNKFFNKKNYLINHAKTSLEILHNTFNKEKSQTLKQFPVDSVNKGNQTACLIDSELVNYNKNDVYHYIQFEMGQLTELTLKGDIKNDYLYYILLNCDNLTSLIFDWCKAEKTLSSITLFIEALKQLSTLSISNCTLTDDNTAILLYSLKNNQSIKTIVLNNNHISPDGLFKFSDCLITNSVLSYIDLSNNAIREIESFLNVINSNNKNITKLNLSGNPLTEDDFEALGEFLGENTSLKHLDISRTRISQRSANHFRISTSKNKTLEELLMNECQFTEDTITIISSQTGNFGIKNIEVNNTIISEGCLIVLSSAVNTMKALEKLFLINTQARGIGLVSLLKIIDKKDQMKELHLEGNEIDENIIIILSTGTWAQKTNPKIYISKKLFESKYLSIASNIPCIVLVEDNINACYIK